MGEPTSALPAPAIAALLYRANGKVPRVASAATLLDLVARRFVTVSCDAEGHSWYGVTGAGREPGEPLLSFERHVLDFVAGRAHLGGGAVPLAGLRLESGEHAKKWYAEFTGLVIDEARRLDLVGDRGAWPLRVLLRLGLLVPAVLAAVLALRGDGGWTLVMYIFFGYAAATLPVRLLNRAVPRRAGIAAAARCRALRADLLRYPIGDRAVDRRAAYALALGVTGSKRGATPFEPGGDLVWSPSTGRWLRVVPQRGLTSGASPMVAVIGLVPALLFSGVWAVLLGGLTLELTWHQVARVWPVLLLVLGWVVWFGGTFRFARWFYRSMYDLVAPPVTVTGQVVHLESGVSTDTDGPDYYYVAVDDGTSDRITRYAISSALHARLRYGSWLRLQIRPKLGSLLHAEILPAPGGPTATRLSRPRGDPR